MPKEMIPSRHPAQRGGRLTRRASRCDAARLAGVSPTTITHVLQGNPKTRVSVETRERIQRVVREIGYTPHALASALACHHARHIAVVAANAARVGSSFLDSLFDVCRDTAQQKGYYMMSYEVATKGAAETGPRMLELVRSGRVDGLLINKSDILTRDIRFLKGAACPLVVIESTFEVDSLNVPAIATDHRLGGRLAMDFLCSLGHRRLAVVTRQYGSKAGPWGRFQDVVFLEGIREAIQAKGMADPVIVEGDCYDRAKTAQAVADLLKRLPRPTGIVFADDIMALTAMGLAGRQGLRVPADLSIVGYGDASFAAYIEPALTTVHVPVSDLGRWAVLTLIDLLEGRPLSSLRQVLEPTLIERGSSGPASSD